VLEGAQLGPLGSDLPGDGQQIRIDRVLFQEAVADEERRVASADDVQRDKVSVAQFGGVGLDQRRRAVAPQLLTAVGDEPYLRIPQGFARQPLAQRQDGRRAGTIVVRAGAEGGQVGVEAHPQPKELHRSGQPGDPVQPRPASEREEHIGQRACDHADKGPAHEGDEQLVPGGRTVKDGRAVCVHVTQQDGALPSLLARRHDPDGVLAGPGGEDPAHPVVAKIQLREHAPRAERIEHGRQRRRDRVTGDGVKESSHESRPEGQHKRAIGGPAGLEGLQPGVDSQAMEHVAGVLGGLALPWRGGAARADGLGEIVDVPEGCFCVTLSLSHGDLLEG